MNSSVRQPLSAHNSIERPPKGLDKNFTFIKQKALPLQDVETFLQEIDRLQLENHKLKQQEPTIIPPVIDAQKHSQILLENSEIKQKLEFTLQKLQVQEKAHNDAMQQLDLNWKQDITTMKYALEQQELRHRQNLRQEQQQSKQEISRLTTQLQQVCNSENKNQNLVGVLEQELVSLKKNNNILEERLQQAIQCFDMQSKDQEFTLMKQQAIITSQESHLQDLKTKYQTSRESLYECQSQLKQLKDSSENKEINEINLKNKLSLIENDFKHLQTTYGEHRNQLQVRIDELNTQNGKSQEQIAILQNQIQKDNEIIKKLQSNLELEIQNKQNEVNGINSQKQQLIQFLEQEVCSLREQNQSFKSNNTKLENQLKEQASYWSFNFKELECKTNMLADECQRLNAIIKQRDDDNLKLRRFNDEIQHRSSDNSQINELLQQREEEINILKQQNDSLIVDLSRQADNYRNLSTQNKQFQKYAEEVKLNNITINELQSKCEIMDKEIERLRSKVLEKSQQLEKAQKENVELQGKLKTKLR